MKSASAIDLRGIVTVSIAALIGVFCIAYVAQATTTISTDISTGGTLSVTGATTLSSTLSVTGLATLGYASSTSQSLTGNFMVGGMATTTGATGNIATQGTLSVTGASTLTGGATVGSAGTAITRLVFGYCTIPDTTVAASSTAYANCTGATGVTSGDRVFVQATSSIHSDFYITAASSTATAGTINVRIHNSGNSGQTTTGVNSFNFWAVR